jgi:hypothetical protein
MSEDDLGEAAQFVLDPADESADPLAILLSLEEQADDIFFAELERILAERKSRRHGVEPNKPTRKASKRAVFH